MIKLDSYLLASYYSLIILSDIDNEIHESEIQVVDKFIDEFQTSKFFDKEEEFVFLMKYSRDERRHMFKEFVEYIYTNAKSSFKNKFYSFSIELISADKVVRDSELELFFVLRDAFGIVENKYIFNAPKEIDLLVKEAINNSSNNNQNIRFSESCFANVEMKFESKDGVLIQRISFDNSKLNYETASVKEKKEMDKMRYLARGISIDMIKSGFLGNKKEILNSRYTFKKDGIDYFVIADFYKNRVMLSYIGCENWDYHIY